MKLPIAEPGIARVANMIGDATRAAMLEALLAGPALPAGELARRARVARRRRVRTSRGSSGTA